MEFNIRIGTGKHDPTLSTPLSVHTYQYIPISTYLSVHTYEINHPKKSVANFDLIGSVNRLQVPVWGCRG